MEDLQESEKPQLLGRWGGNVTVNAKNEKIPFDFRSIVAFLNTFPRSRMCDYQTHKYPRVANVAKMRMESSEDVWQDLVEECKRVKPRKRKIEKHEYITHEDVSNLVSVLYMAMAALQSVAILERSHSEKLQILFPAEGASIDDVVAATLIEALRQNRWEQKAAAHFLGMSPRMMGYRLEKLKLDVKDLIALEDENKVVRPVIEKRHHNFLPKTTRPRPSRISA